MKLLSVNVGLPRQVTHRGNAVATGIFKQPVPGRVWLGPENLAGDGQGDLRAHGGPHKAVYAYPHEHYAYWAEALGRDDLGFGQFGENFTTEGLLEEAVRIGDVFRVGGALVQVSQPRTPCFKLGIRMGAPGFVKRFLASERSGFYLRVLEPGEVGAGDAIERVAQDEAAMSVREVNHLKHFAKNEREAIARAAGLAALSPDWRESFQARLEGDAE